jgi:hypothetical protein
MCEIKYNDPVTGESLEPYHDEFICIPEAIHQQFIDEAESRSGLTVSLEPIENENKRVFLPVYRVLIPDQGFAVIIFQETGALQ